MDTSTAFTERVIKHLRDSGSPVPDEVLEADEWDAISKAEQVWARDVEDRLRAARSSYRTRFSGMKRRDLEFQHEISRTQHRESTPPGTLCLDRVCVACESLGFIEVQVELNRL